VLLCYLGMALHAAQKFPAALDALRRAETLVRAILRAGPARRDERGRSWLCPLAQEPANSQAKYQMAMVLMAMDRPEVLRPISNKGAAPPDGVRAARWQEALEHLLRVRELAPREAAVHFELGKVQKKLKKVRTPRIADAVLTPHVPPPDAARRRHDELHGRPGAGAQG
jgi:hypothetical protein